VRYDSFAARIPLPQASQIDNRQQKSGSVGLPLLIDGD